MATYGAIQIQVTINNKSFTFHKDHAVSLKVKRTMGDSANEFTLELFDETAWQVENVLMGSQLAPIVVRYSAANNLNNSITFAGTCLNYQVSFVGTATLLTIEGILSASSGDSSGWWFERANIEWVGQWDGNESIDGKDKSVWSNYENNEDVCAFLDYPLDKDGKPSETPVVYYNPSRIFKRIIHAYNGDKLGSNGANAIEGWGTGGSGKFSIAECDDSRWIAGLDCRQTNETAAQYITRVLCKSAITWTRGTVNGVSSEAKYEDETAGFRYFVDGKGHHFVKIDYNSKDASKVEITYGSKNSNIISFSIANIGSLIMAGGKNQVDASSTSDLYGDIINQGGSNVYNANVEENKDNEEYINWYFGSQTEKKFKGIKVVSSSPESSLGARKDSVWKDIKNYTFNAELTVVGTYSNMYAPGNFIDIVLKNKNGLIHYATGRYMIIQIDDNVSTSEFTQTMKLIKNTGNTTSSTIYKLNMQQTVNEETNTNTGTTAYTPVYGPAYTREKEFSGRTQTPAYRQVNNTLPNNISMGGR